MRSIHRSLGIFFLAAAALPAAGQTARPQFRPSVLPTGPTSIINRIDVKDLLSKGQKDGAVQFSATVSPNGDATEAWTYHAIPGSEALEREVLQRLEGAKFTPAIYNHQPVAVLLYGTVIFVAEEKPHLRILLNQDPQEIKEANDFIGPQPVIGGDSRFTGLHPPEEIPVMIKGVVELQLGVDAKGNLQELRVSGEDPPLLGFRDSALADLKDAKFIPAFRNGDLTESKCAMSICYRAAEFEVSLDP